MDSYLLNLGVSQKTLDYLNEEIPSLLFDLSFCKESVFRIVNYLKHIGIKSIDTIFRYENRIFYIDYDKIVASFNSKNIEEVVENINSDVFALDDVL